MQNNKTFRGPAGLLAGGCALLAARVACAAEEAAEKNGIDATAVGSAPMKAAAPALNEDAVRQIAGTVVEQHDPTTFTIIALAAGGLALVLALALFYLHIQQNSALKRTKSDLRAQAAETKRLRSRLETQQKTIDGLAKALAAQDARPAAAPAAPVMPASAPQPAPEPAITDEMRYRDFVAAYNELRAKSKAMSGSMALRKDRQAFFQRYGLIGLSCTNSEARMTDAALAPVFAEQPLQSADFWAYPMPDGSGRYAVVPSAHPYTSELHRQGGGAEAFASRYAGGTCQNITVLRPAIFSSSLAEIEEKGELRLA